MKLRLALLTSLFITSSAFAADSLTVNMTNLQTGEPAGTVTISQHPYGTVLTPDLHGLSAGNHGFHVHEIPACGPKQKNGEMVKGGAAGSHFDPDNTGRHGTPWDFDGHAGDLPALYVDANGMATQPVLAPKLKLKQFKNHSLMIHVNGDNYSDNPKPLGGGGARMACGVIN